MPALSKKYRINYSKRYITSKNKKQRGRKSIKVYNHVRPTSRKRKHYIGGDIEVPAINNIFPSGQTYQPNTDCLEKECDKDDAGKKTTTCLNTRIAMNLFSQNLDADEEKTMDRIDGNFTEEERKQVQDLTEKYLTNYVNSLFSKSIFSKNNADLTPVNTIKLKELLEAIQPKHVEYLKRDSNLSDDIKEKIQAIQEELNVVDNATPDTSTATTPATAPTIVNVPASPTSTATTIVNAPPIIDNAVVEAELAKKAAEDAEAAKKALEDAEAQRLRVEAEKKTADDAEAERLRQIAEAEQAKKANINETTKLQKTKIEAIEKANKAREDAVNLAKQTRTAAVELANQELDKNIKEGKLSDVRYNFFHNDALRKAKNAEEKAIEKAEKAQEKAIKKANKAEEKALDANNRKILAKKNPIVSKPANNP
jgi:hypothetical protein